MGRATVPESPGGAAGRGLRLAVARLRRVGGRALLGARAGRDRWASRAMEAALERWTSPIQTGDELVEASLVIPPAGSRRFCLGTSPKDGRVSMLADLREPGALPPMTFSRIVLTRPFTGRGRGTARANVARALMPSGELTAIMSRKSQLDLEARGLDTVEVRRSKLARVVRMRRRP